MSMLDVHSSSLAQINEAHHNFLLRYCRDKKIVYGIVEGKDDPTFYRSVIERFIPNDWSVDLILAGNKTKVIQAHSFMDWNCFSDEQVVFFVDRDLSAYLVEDETPVKNIYVTDGYSIENAIVNSAVFFRLIVEACNVVDTTQSEEATIINAFNEDLTLFQGLMAPIMAQILGWRRDRVNVELDELALSSLVEFKDGRLFIAQGFEDDLARISHLSTSVGVAQYDANDLASLKTRFQSISSPELYVRGKYLLWFLAASVTHMHQNITKFVSAYSKCPKANVTVGARNVMVIAAPRARIPQSLRSFIERTFLHYIANTAMWGGA